MGSNSSKITQQHKRDLNNGLKALENQMNDKFKASSANQQVLDLILRSQGDLQRLVKSMDEQHNQLKLDIIVEISRIREQQGDFLNQSRIHETKMEEEITTQISSIHEKISQDQDSKFLQSFTSLQTKLSQVDQRLTEMNTSFSDKQVSLEKSILIQMKESQELLNEQTSKIIEEQVSNQFQKISEIFEQKVLKVENEMATQQIRLQTIEESIKTLEQNASSIQNTQQLQKSIKDIEKKMDEVQQKVNKNKETQELTTQKELTQLKQEMNELKTTIARLEKLISQQNENFSNQINTIKNNTSKETEDSINKQLTISTKSNLNASISPFNSQLPSTNNLKEETTPVVNKKNDILAQKREKEQQKIDALLRIQENFMKRQSSKVSISSDNQDDEDDKDSIESDNYPKKKKYIQKQKQSEKQQTALNEKKSLINNVFAAPSLDLKQTFDCISLTSQQSLKEDSTPRTRKNVVQKFDSISLTSQQSLKEESTPRARKNFIQNQENYIQKPLNNQGRTDKTPTNNNQQKKSFETITSFGKDKTNYKKNFKTDQ